MSALAAARPAVAMLSPAVSLLGVFVAAPMALTIWLSFQDWSTGTGFERGALHRTRQFLRDFWADLGRSRLQGRADQHRTLHSRFGRRDPAPFCGVWPPRLSTACERRRRAQDHSVFDLYGADGRRRARLVEALFAERRSDQSDTRLGRPAAQPMALLARHGAGLDRDSQRLAAGRLFHGASGRGLDADSCFTP